MERDETRQDDILTIDLGGVATETRGPGPVGADSIGLERIQLGLSDD
jgi:hypothetical protein